MIDLKLGSMSDERCLETIVKTASEFPGIAIAVVLDSSKERKYTQHLKDNGLSVQWYDGPVKDTVVLRITKHTGGMA